MAPLCTGTSLIRPPNEGASSFTSATASPLSATFVHAFTGTGQRADPPTGGGASRSNTTPRTASGEPSVTSARSGQSGWAHSASYAITEPSECATITSVRSVTCRASRSWTAARTSGSVK
ncbi:hypothetical protein [Streptomyces sp. NPDC059743]|uniref:hypothetical protein n=1 Tax=Streptomyces sp. NPDC059743 TaxID=3346928 RepID=UPI003648D4DF